MTIEKWLHNIGVSLIVLGLVSAFVGLFSLDSYSNYKDAKEVYDNISDNEYAVEQYIQARDIWMGQITLYVGSLFINIIAGLLLMGLGKMITLQEKIADNIEGLKS